MGSRGFVTLATGSEYYYKLASNMLRSYKLHNKNSRFSFAILCDRENNYTKEFDDVVLLAPVRQQYTSKFELLVNCPYEENIFIEPDCLIYKDISILWEYLVGENDFTAFGWNNGNYDVWFTKEVCEYYGISNIPIFNPGYLFIRQGKKCERIYKDCLEISEYLEKNKDTLPKCYVKDVLRDDPVLAMAMKLNNCYCPVKPKIGKLLSLPSEKLLSAHISRGILVTESCSDGRLLHFSTKRTRQGLYLQQLYVMRMCERNFPNWMISVLESNLALKMLEIICKIRYLLKT